MSFINGLFCDNGHGIAGRLFMFSLVYVKKMVFTGVRQTVVHTTFQIMWFGTKWVYEISRTNGKC